MQRNWSNISPGEDSSKSLLPCRRRAAAASRFGKSPLGRAAMSWINIGKIANEGNQVEQQKGLRDVFFYSDSATISLLYPTNNHHKCSTEAPFDLEPTLVSKLPCKVISLPSSKWKSFNHSDNLWSLRMRLHSEGLAFSFNWCKEESRALSGKASLQQRLTVFKETIKGFTHLVKKNP